MQKKYAQFFHMDIFVVAKHHVEGTPIHWLLYVPFDSSGWINAITAMGSNKAVGVIMMVVAAFFTTGAALSVVLLKMVSSSEFWSENLWLFGLDSWVIGVFQVHSNYRRTGASFQKAQQELSQGVLTNRTFQSAAASAATTAAQSTLQRN